jgi:hypothetical protein
MGFRVEEPALESRMTPTNLPCSGSEKPDLCDDCHDRVGIYFCSDCLGWLCISCGEKQGWRCRECIAIQEAERERLEAERNYARAMRERDLEEYLGAGGRL